MNRISKQQQTTINDLRTRWLDARNALDVAQSEANEVIEKAVAEVQAKIADLNAIIEEANAVREEIENDAQSYYDEKSEKWQEGDRGSAFSEWKDAWSNEVEEIEEITVESIDVLDNVPEEILSEDDYPTEPNF